MILIFLLGLVIGTIATIKLFGLHDIDLLSLPYENKSVVLEDSVTLNQKGVRINLPKGTELTLVYRSPEGVGIFSIPVIFEMQKEPRLLPLPGKTKYFEGLISSETSTVK